MRYYTEEEYIFATHDRDVRNQVDDIRNTVDDLMDSINNLIDDYMDLVEEGMSLGLEEDEIMEDYAGWVGEFEELKKFIEDKKLNL